PPHPYTLSLHDALPILPDHPGLFDLRHAENVRAADRVVRPRDWRQCADRPAEQGRYAKSSSPSTVNIALNLPAHRTLYYGGAWQDRKSTRLNSSHVAIS